MPPFLELLELTQYNYYTIDRCYKSNKIVNIILISQSIFVLKKYQPHA